jgi:hypothetical protein
MKRILLAGVAALFLATGTAHASDYYAIQCGKKRIFVLGHHGYSFTDVVADKELPSRHFQAVNGQSDRISWRYRGRRCVERIQCGGDPDDCVRRLKEMQ